MSKDPTAGRSPFKAFKRIIFLLAMMMLITVLGMLIASLVIRWVGGVEQWYEWSHNHYGGLLTWRCLLYAALTYAWLKIQPWKLASSPGDRLRLMGLQAAAVILIVLVEFKKAPVDWGALL